MTVSSQVSSVSYLGDGVTTLLPVPYYFLEQTHLLVTRVNVDTTTTTLVLGSDYSVSGAGNQAGGSVTMFVAPAVGVQILIQRSVPATQETDYVANDPFPAESHERALDKLTMLVQQAFSYLSRALLRPVGKNYYDAEGRKIVNLGDGAGEQDTVNIRTMRSYVDTAIAGVVGGFGYFIQNYVGAVLRTFQDKMREPYPSLEDFGGKGDYVTDNLPAWNLLLASGAKGLTVTKGIFRFSDGIERPAGFKIKGQGAPVLGFGTIDDKQYLRPGYKHLMPGSSFIFSGTGTLVCTLPQRTDEFATVRPCMRIFNNGLGSQNVEISGLAIIQDMDCFDADGVATKPGFENKADYEAGPLIDDAARTLLNDVVTFGYFTKAGTIISSKSGNDDPDYTTIYNGSTMGKHGLAILGSNNGPAAFGLSGTRVFGTGLYTLDHHARGDMTVPELTAYYSTANTWDTVYIDGDVNATSAEINGHYFYGVEMRTRANHPLRLDHASNVEFFGGVCEISPYGIPNSDVPEFIGSANVKRGIGFYGMRNNFLSTIFNSNFVGLIPLPVIVSGDPLNGRMGVFGKDPSGGYAGSILGSDGNIGDASIQLTKDANDGSAGWKMNLDVSVAGIPLQWKNEGVIKASLTDLGVYSVAAPAGSDGTFVATSNAGANVWAQRAQTSSSGQWQFRYGGSGSTPVLQILTNGTLTPGTTGVPDVGTASLRYKDCYLVNAPNVSSDENLKEQIGDIPESWLVAARNIRPVRYKMKAAVEKKGDEAARWHIGVSAQQVIQAFAEQGVDAFSIGLVGRDTWEAHYDDVMEEVMEAVIGEDGEPTGELMPTGELRPTGKMVMTREAGEELNVRYEELLALMQAARL